MVVWLQPYLEIPIQWKVFSLVRWQAFSSVVLQGWYKKPPKADRTFLCSRGNVHFTLLPFLPRDLLLVYFSLLNRLESDTFNHYSKLIHRLLCLPPPPTPHPRHHSYQASKVPNHPRQISLTAGLLWFHSPPSPHCCCWLWAKLGSRPPTPGLLNFFRRLNKELRTNFSPLISLAPTCYCLA